MGSKHLRWFLVILSATVAYQCALVGVIAQTSSNIRLNGLPVRPASPSLQLQKLQSPRPLTPGEQALATARKKEKLQPMNSGLLTSSTQIFKTGIVSLSGGQNTMDSAAGDVNGDGKTDLVMASWCATTNCSSGVVSVLLGNGDGTYQTPVTYATTGEAVAVALADVNGDGKLDIVAVTPCNSDCSSGAVNVLLGNGDGTFQAAVSYNTGGADAYSLVVADVNGDSKPDLLVVDECSSNSSCSTGLLSVLLGNGDGTFQTAVTYNAAGPSTQAIAAADLNGDGKLDVALASSCNNQNGCSSGLVSVLLGNGDGTFQTANGFGTVGEGTNAIAIGDVNGDGHPDILASNSCNNSSSCSNGAFVVLLGNGDGTFQSGVQYNSGGLQTQSLGLADLNGDGKLDVVVSNQCSSNSNCEDGGNATVFLGNGDGTFQQSASYANGSNNFEEMGPDSSSILLADVNGDGKTDVLVTSSCYGGNFICDTGAVSVLLGYGDGTLDGAVLYQPQGLDAYGLATADVNGDGNPDVLVAEQCQDSNCTTGAVSVLLGNGDGTFQPGGIYASGGLYALWIVTGDVNGDGKTDVVVSNECASNSNCSQGTLSVLLGNGDGTFQSPITYATGEDGQSVTLADVNGDGKLDIVLSEECADSNCDSGAVAIMLGNGDGTFQSAVSYNSGGTWTMGAAAGDVNGDGKADLVVSSECLSQSNCSNGIMAVLLGNGDGTFQPAVTYNSGGENAQGVQLADMNNDGKLDIVVQNECASSSNCNNGSVSVLLGNGDGTFQTAVSANMPQSIGWWGSLIVGDFNGDHKLDVASGGSGAYLLGNGDGTLQAAQSLGSNGAGITSADFNGDGRPDLALGGVAILLNISNGFLISTTTSLNSSNNPSSYGQSVTFTATVNPQTPNTPTGTITFSDGSNQLGQAPLSSGSASLTTAALALGSHSITASYSGDSNFNAGVSSVLTQVVAMASTTTTLSGSPNPAAVGQNVTFTATVNPATSGTPTGTVSFFDGSTQIGSSSLSSGVATLSTTSLAAGAHNVTAVYSGDSNFNASTSNSVNETVSAPGFSLSSTPLTSTTVQDGGSAKWTITINPSGGFNPSTVNLTCSVTPVATAPVTCSATAVSVSGGVGTATLNVATTAAYSNAKRVASRDSGMHRVFLLAVFVPGLCLSGFGLGNTKRRKLFALGIVMLVCFGCILQTACGGYSSSPKVIPGTAQGTYQVTVTGTSGAIQQTTSVAVTVQ
jgi:Bacterial Ig-like domain (group 3)/FG-GAP-like repeat/FG-GAP repeat